MMNNRELNSSNDSNFDSFVERVKEENNIVEVIGERVRLKPVGEGWVGFCIFHDDRNTPNLNIFSHTQSFCCFACKAGGDVITFVMEEQNLDFHHAVRFLAERKGIPFSLNGELANSEEAKVRSAESALREAATLYHRNLPLEVREYLKNERGLTDETIDQNLIGFCNGNTQFQTVSETLIEAGLLYESGKERFEGFITFPHFHHNRIVYMTGRGYPEKAHMKLPREKIPLLHPYRGRIPKKGLPILVEGEIDALTLWQNGFNSYSIGGVKGFKDEWASHFRNYEMVYVALDGDETGENETFRVGEHFGNRAQVVKLPHGFDPNEYFKHHSKEDFESLITSAEDIIKYQLGQIPTDTDKTKLPQRLERILKQLARMEEATAEAYLREVKERYDLTERDLDCYRKMLKKYRAELDITNETVANNHVHTEYKALFDGLVDIVEHEDNPAFLIKEGEKLSIVSQVQREGKVYIPPPKDRMDWLLPRSEEVLKYYENDTDGELYDALLNYHKEISELPSEKYYDLLAAWDFHTYCLEHTQSSPILWLFAIPERGKSRTGKGSIYVAYRGIYVDELREAYLLRVSTRFRASIFFDLIDVWKTAKNTGCSDILLHRYQKGALSHRINPDLAPFEDIISYEVFGSTIIATNEGVHQTLETRAMQVNMPDSSKEFENDVTPELGLPFRERLVAFRARHLGEPLPDIPKPAAKRLGEISKPLLQIIRLVKPEREQSFLELIRELEGERLIDKSDSPEAQIVAAIIGLEDEVQVEKEEEVLPVKKITAVLNVGKPERYKFGEKSVGWKLKAMGFKKRHQHYGAVIVWDDQLLERLKASFGLLEKKADHKPNSQSEHTENPEPPDKGELADDSEDLLQG